MSLDLRAALQDARARTLAYVEDLSGAQLQLPMIDTVNPVLWELGHVAYFAEFWTLRGLYGRDPIIEGADALYDSAKIAHDTRWSLPLPDREGTLAFLARQLTEVLERYPEHEATAASTYFHRLALHHEDMHAEAMIYMRGALAYAQPQLPYLAKPQTEIVRGDVAIPGGTYRIGARPTDAFVWDNEKWEHEVEIAPFSISRTAVTNEEYLQFIENGAEPPPTWRKTNDGWERRHFDRWAPLVPREPVVHVSALDAQAYCQFAGRRLPTEAEWEIAATGGKRRTYPWGEEAPSPQRANLDNWYGDVVSVDAFESGESPFGVRGMLGNVWEWTATPFGPYPGFSPDPYREYSEPWFGDHRVLRGGAWSTRARMITARWRNFYKPHRRDILTGFRTCHD